MFKSILSCIGLLFLSIKTVMGDMSLVGLLQRLWLVVIFSGIMGGILDLSFTAFYREAVERINGNGK